MWFPALPQICAALRDKCQHTAPGKFTSGIVTGAIVRILFISDNFPPEVNAPASRTYDHCREWVRSGHEVTVITSAPNFPKGKVYDGYKNRIWSRENIDGIAVIRVWSYITANEGVYKRTADFISFMISSFAASLFIKRHDLVIGTSPQFFSACSAYLIGAIHGMPFVFEVRDLWPESIKVVGAMSDSLFIRLLEKVESFLYRKAALIVTVTATIRQCLIERGIAAGKLLVVTNGVDTSRFKPLEKNFDLLRELDLENKFVVGYIGTHGMAHALETILLAAERLCKERNDRYRFLFLGHGARKSSLMDMAKRLSLSNVVFIDSVPKDEVPRYWSALDVAVTHLKRVDLFAGAIPSKMFECMAMGIPLLHGIRGESASIVENLAIGLVFEPENHDDLYEKLIKLERNGFDLAAMKANSIDSARRYDRKFLANTMLENLERIFDKERR